MPANRALKRMKQLDNYIVRIYRRGGTEELAGLVIDVDKDEKKPFTSPDELLGLLKISRDTISLERRDGRRKVDRK